MRLALALALFNAAPSADAGAAASDFQHLMAIAGEWRSQGKPLDVSYRPMSAGTTLVETYGARSGHETMTVFHPDVSTLMATHYCAQGNQPRLRLTLATTTRWVFTFADATNLPNPKATHLVQLELRLSDANHLTRIETYLENGKPDVATLHLQRLSDVGNHRSDDSKE